jgi:hypothetical protein
MNDEERTSSRTLRADLAWAHALLRLEPPPDVTVKPEVSALALLGLELPGVATVKPEVHGLLFDCFLRLSESYSRRSRLKAARRLRRVAAWHYARSGQSDPPPAAAVALPVPRRPSFVWAVGRDPHDPNAPDAA